MSNELAADAFGGFGDAPGQFEGPGSVAVVRGLIVVSEEKRLQVLTPKGVPLQVLTVGADADLAGISANEECVWVTDVAMCRVHVLKVL